MLNSGENNTSIDSTLKQSDQQLSGNEPLLVKIIVDINDPGHQVEQQHKPDGSNDDQQEQTLIAEFNDVLQVDKQLDADWLLVKSDQSIGKVLRRWCRILDDELPTVLCQYLVDNQYFNLQVCFASFVAQDVGDLSLTKGDVIVGINQINEHWMQGKVCFDGQSNSWPKLHVGEQMGTFPLNHCWQLDDRRIELLCRKKISGAAKFQANAAISQPWPTDTLQERTNLSLKRLPLLSTAHSSSCSSSVYSTIDHQYTIANRQYNHHDAMDNSSQNSNNDNNNYASQSNYNISHINKSNTISESKVPPRPSELPAKQFFQGLSISRQKSASEQAVVVRVPSTNGRSIISNKQQDKLRSWIHTVKKKTARLSTRITASLGLISLTRDEEFEKHYESFKQLEKTIRIFIRNISAFLEHYESFLMALQNTSENLSEFFRDRPQNQRELVELKRKNKALHCEHFHAFKRTVDRQVIAVSSQLLQKFSGPHQLVNKRSTKLLDYDTKTKEIESCRDLEKKAALRDQYVIAKDLYDRINGQLIHELPLFNQFALEIFRDCILVLLESRRNFIMSYTKQTASLLDTPLMSSYTASDVVSTILMSCNDQSFGPKHADHPNARNTNDLRTNLNNNQLAINRQMSGGTQPSGSSGGEAVFSDGTSVSRPQSAMSQLSSDIDQINGMVVREISSTPLSQISGGQELIDAMATDEPDGGVANANHGVRINISRISSNGSSDNRHNESIESRIESARSKPYDIGSTPPPPQPPKAQAIADSDLDENTIQQIRGHINSNGNNKSKKKNKKSYPIYVASWPFVATGPNQLTVACNQQLKLVKDSDECGNADWSLVKDKRGHLGYVPSSYIKKRE